MENPSLKGKRVTVFGLGLNDGGVGTVEFLAGQGVREIIVTDIKKREELAPSIKRLSSLKNITYILGQHRPEDFSRVDLVVKNPVIPWSNEYVRLAEKHGVPVEMDSSLFFAFSRNKVIGVTGSKGKTSVSSMLAHLLRTGGVPVVKVGVSQTPVLGLLGRLKPDETVVFELSSWRLSALGRKEMSPKLSIVTNIFPDHLNYYKTMSSYIRDKKYIYGFQKKGDTVILNADCDATRTMAEDAPGRVLFFSATGDLHAHDGAFFRNGIASLFFEGKESPIFSFEDVKIPGEHNRENMLAAALAAFISGVPKEKLKEGVRTFKGVPHRLELVAEKQGVTYWNDTAATIPEAAISGLQAFEGKPIILLAGGSDKNLRFDVFAKEVLERTKGIVFFEGAATEQLKHELCKIIPEEEKGDCRFEEVTTMAKAVELASRGASAGDVVLLSPGAASFGLFKNEFDRGNQFKEVVLALPEK
jgi:UDP-N-acetylmuramoylalanine--D-glutamate ligase